MYSMQFYIITECIVCLNNSSDQEYFSTLLKYNVIRIKLKYIIVNRNELKCRTISDIRTSCRC